MSPVRAGKSGRGLTRYRASSVHMRLISRVLMHVHTGQGQEQQCSFRVMAVGDDETSMDTPIRRA